MVCYLERETCSSPIYLWFSTMTSELIIINHLIRHSTSTALGTTTGYWKPTGRGTDETPHVEFVMILSYVEFFKPSYAYSNIVPFRLFGKKNRMQPGDLLKQLKFQRNLLHCWHHIFWWWINRGRRFLLFLWAFKEFDCRHRNSS